MADEVRARGDRRRLVGTVLRDLRLEANLRQSDIAQHLGAPQSVISKIESGERTADAVEIYEICTAVGVSMAEFVRRLERRLGVGS
jgi:transcriptional regulator with XRE-family HTH domain